MALIKLYNLCLNKHAAAFYKTINTIPYNTYNFIAKYQYNCTRNVLWCQVHSWHIGNETIVNEQWTVHETAYTA